MINHLPVGEIWLSLAIGSFQIGRETRTIEIDDSIVRGYASDTERDRRTIRKFVIFTFQVPSFWTFRLVRS